MKFLVTAVLMISSSAAFAAATNLIEKGEGIAVMNALLANPEATQQLNEKDVSVNTYSIAVPTEGVNVYTFELDRHCFCPRYPGTLTITEDTRPARADGPIKYSYELVWKQKN